MTECHALNFVTGSVHMHCFLPIRTNFVKNIKLQYSYLGKFCRDRCNYVKIIHLIASKYVLISAATFCRKWPLHYQLYHTFCLLSLQPSSASIYNNMLTYIVIECQFKDISSGNVSVNLCIPIFCYNRWTYCQVGGTLPNKRNTIHRAEQLHKKIVGFTKHRASTR